MNRHDLLIEELLLRWDKHFERLLAILEKGENAKHYKGAPEPPYHLPVPPSLNQTRFDGHTYNREKQKGGGIRERGAVGVWTKMIGKF